VGFVIDAAQARLLERVGLIRPSVPGFAEARRVEGRLILVQKDLARTLGRIAADGADGFYKGAVAELIEAEMKDGGGLITRKDLETYAAHERKPVHGTYRGHDVYGVPPSSSGGTCTVEILNILEQFDLKAQGRWSPATLHLMTEAMRRAYRDRARYLGDPDFVTVPARLTTKEHAKELAKGIDLRKATPSRDLAGDLALTGEGEHTTHFSVIDRNGMAVSLTYTLESLYGSRVVVKGGGFLLNDEMNDFNWRPGRTDDKGHIGTDANLVAPGKRMLSSMSPTVVAKDGKVVLVTGSPGGRTIINTVVCVLVNVLDFGMPVREAVDAPRMHHQWFPDSLHLEPGLKAEHPESIEGLRKMGHVLAPAARQGDAHTIYVDARGTRVGAADRRIAGSAAGY
jgi:gamma-glutamyltranspeptidase/glutathione hydrolase